MSVVSYRVDIDTSKLEPGSTDNSETIRKAVWYAVNYMLAAEPSKPAADVQHL